MFYGKIYRAGESSQFWTFRFNSKKVFAETQELLISLRDSRVSKFQYEWKWNMWRLERVNKLSDFPKDLRGVIKEDSEKCDHPQVVIDRIERIHEFWDSHFD